MIQKNTTKNQNLRKQKKAWVGSRLEEICFIGSSYTENWFSENRYDVAFFFKNIKCLVFARQLNEILERQPAWKRRLVQEKLLWFHQMNFGYFIHCYQFWNECFNSKLILKQWKKASYIWLQNWIWCTSNLSQSYLCSYCFLLINKKKCVSMLFQSFLSEASGKTQQSKTK